MRIWSRDVRNFVESPNNINNSELIVWPNIKDTFTRRKAENIWRNKKAIYNSEEIKIMHEKYPRKIKKTKYNNEKTDIMAVKYP